MNISTLESLPNELLLLIFAYLSSLDLCRAFVDIKNARIQCLLTSLRHVLDVSSMHYNQFHQFLKNNNDQSTKYLITLIDTVVLRDSPACMILTGHWKKTLNDPENANVWLSAIKQLLVLNADHYTYGFVQPLLIPLVCHYNMLQYLHLVFEQPTHEYPPLLSQLVLHRISVPTMILEVENGHQYYRDDLLKVFQQIKPLCWPNTVQLTLSILHSSELLLLFQDDALPIIEHLDVTNEEIRTSVLSEHQKSISTIELCGKHCRQTANHIRLQSLVIRYIPLVDLILLIDSLNMSSLEKLTLVDLYDHTFDHLGTFKQLCSSTHLPALKYLHFSFCFPKELKQTWQNSLFARENEWPFDNMDCYTDEVCISSGEKFGLISETVLIVYKRPIDILFKHKRICRNHHFARHISLPINTVQRRSLTWTYDHLSEPNQLVKTFQVLASTRTNKFCLNNLFKETTMSMTSICVLFLPHLRSVIFNFKFYSEKNWQRVAIVSQILDGSPNLSHLVVPWSVFRYCSKTYRNLKNVHLQLERLRAEPKHHLQINRLSQLVPHLCQLETSHANLIYNEHLVEFVLDIIRHFRQLTYLTLNKDNLYPSKEEKKIIFKEQLLTAAANQRLFDANDICIRFGNCHRLFIWF